MLGMKLSYFIVTFLAISLFISAFSVVNIGSLKIAASAQEQPTFTQYYSLPPSLKIEFDAPQYVLPLNTDDIYNFQNFSTKIPLTNSSVDLLKKNGFVVTAHPLGTEEDMTAPYKSLKELALPIFLTADSLLHFYHIQFDQTLKEIEESHFYDKMWNLSKDLFDESVKLYESTDQSQTELKQAARLDAAFFAVALSLLKPSQEQICASEPKNEIGGFEFSEGNDCPEERYFENEDLEKYKFETASFIKDVVEEELQLIGRHSGFENSSLFGTQNDYSQYVPRGHYDSSEKLRNYFKALMWYGRNTFLLKDDVQTLAASLIAFNLENNKLLKDDWNTIYSVTSFYVGFSDDLGPAQYIGALKNISSSYTSNPTAIFKDKKLLDLRAQLVKLPLPKIYSGLGNCTVVIDPLKVSEDTEEQIKSCMTDTMGMRFIGQRFIPDSYVFSELVGPHYEYIGKSPDAQLPFTAGKTPAGIMRVFPRGLDVMHSMLNSSLAGELVTQAGDDNYSNYNENLTKLKEEFDKLGPKDWNKNLYWSWLYSLKPLVEEYGAGYPTFMQTAPWLNKELTTALASWSQLRHDTILYAKQSYTGEGATLAEPPSIPPPVPGYVEPVPEFYSRLLALTNMTYAGLSDMNLLEGSKYRLEQMISGLQELVAISQKELQGNELSDKDIDFISDFHEWTDAIVSGHAEVEKKTTIIADVHTDSNSGQVLQEGTGYVKLIVVAFKVPDGRILIGAAPVFSYYEFKQPMENRLTDQAWRSLLASNAPDEPKWIETFSTN